MVLALLLLLLLSGLIPGTVVVYRRGFDELGSVLAGLATTTLIFAAAVVTVIVEDARQPPKPAPTISLSRP